MIKQDLKLSDKDIDEFTKQFSKRYIFKKKMRFYVFSSLFAEYLQYYIRDLFLKILY